MLDRPLKDIAGDLGLTPEALSRALAHLQKVGEITRNQRKITFCKGPIRIDLSHGVSML
jgi:CRP/FNR family transcriptional regulator, dissimilatory nitrate respiration regulator